MVTTQRSIAFTWILSSHQTLTSKSTIFLVSWLMKTSFMSIDHDSMVSWLCIGLTSHFPTAPWKKEKGIAREASVLLQFSVERGQRRKRREREKTNAQR